jgi:hypothetical protein
MKYNLMVGLVLASVLFVVDAANLWAAGPSGSPTGWNLKTESIDVSSLISKADGPIIPQHVWIKRDANYTYLLVEAKGLKEYILAAKGPVIFLILYFDSDADAGTGSSGKKIAGQELSGFDFSADLSVMQIREKDGKVSSVLNCQVAKWDGKEFSGDLAWGTRFNRKMSASSQGDYATFTIPRSIFDVTRKGIPARIAVDVPNAKYVEGKQAVVPFNLNDK